MSRPRPGPRQETAAVFFRGEIERAEAAGTPRDQMTLRLTLRDMSQLKRDRSLALTDIRFTDGVMSFLGVTVLEGGVEESALSLTSAA